MTFNVATDPAGACLVTLPVSLGEAEMLFAQAVHADATKPLGLASTNVAHTILGGAGICDCIYNWSVDGPIAQFGPRGVNFGAVILVR